jgi:exodeoxyribonuclease-1
MTYRKNFNSAPVTLYWHDYETGGLDKALDRPLQFAGIRTDLNLNIIGEPLTLFCKVAADTVPDPRACLLTGITPQRCEREGGVNEAEFARRILDELSKPGTCGVGFNTIRFDDEVTRNLLYRTLHDPYEREWMNGNSRWDIIDLVRAVYALRPSALTWLTDDEGKVSFRLEKLADANGLIKERAHDAVSDVKTTIALAKLIKERTPELFHHYFGLRSKNNAMAFMDLSTQNPVFHVSSFYGVDRHCLAPIMPVAKHPTQTNVFLAFDLAADPTEILGLPAEEIAERLFTRDKSLRLPLSTIHTNKSPFLIPPKAVDHQALGIEQLGAGFDKQAASATWKLLKARGAELSAKLQQALALSERSYIGADPELSIYAGFASRNDKALFSRVHASPPEALGQPFPFENPMYQELLFRHRARNWPETLSEAEAQQWESFVRDRIHQGGPMNGRTLADYQTTLQEIKDDPATANHPLLPDLEAWVEQRLASVPKPVVRGPSP